MLMAHIGIGSTRQFQCAPTTYVLSINKYFFTIKQVFSQKSQLLFMFQCNEHVEINMFLCSLACTWMTISNSQFYFIDSFVGIKRLGFKSIVCCCYNCVCEGWWSGVCLRI